MADTDDNFDPPTPQAPQIDFGDLPEHAEIDETDIEEVTVELSEDGATPEEFTADTEVSIEDQSDIPGAIQQVMEATATGVNQALQALAESDAKVRAEVNTEVNTALGKVTLALRGVQSGMVALAKVVNALVDANRNDRAAIQKAVDALPEALKPNRPDLPKADAGVATGMGAGALAGGAMGAGDEDFDIEAELAAFAADLENMGPTHNTGDGVDVYQGPTGTTVIMPPEQEEPVEHGGTYDYPYEMLPAIADMNTETAQTDTWDRTTAGTAHAGTAGVKWWGPRYVYKAEDDGGDGILYRFTRVVTFDSDGCLATISAETKVEVDEPLPCAPEVA